MNNHIENTHTHTHTHTHTGQSYHALLSKVKSAHQQKTHTRGSQQQDDRVEILMVKKGEKMEELLVGHVLLDVRASIHLVLRNHGEKARYCWHKHPSHQPPHFKKATLNRLGL